MISVINERATADAISQCHTILSLKSGATWILEGDIKSCFDRISHDWLLSHIPMDKPVLQKWLKAGFMEKHVLYPTEDGTPQGGIITPLTMLQKIFTRVWSRRAGADSEDDIDLFLLDFNLLD